MQRSLTHLLLALQLSTAAAMEAKQTKALDGDSPANAGPLASALSPDLSPQAVESAIRKVGDWQLRRVRDTPSREWTYAALYIGLLAAGEAIHEPRYMSAVAAAGSGFSWELGPRITHADDQAIGQAYLELYRVSGEPELLTPIRKQFNLILSDPKLQADSVWWWCDALFMAPPLWAGLSAATGDTRYVDFMNKQWHISDSELYDSETHLYFRDKSYLQKRESNGQKLLWSRGNGWVFAGLARLLEQMPPNDAQRAFYEQRFKAMGSALLALQGDDGLWRAGLLAPESYKEPEISGSAFFVYGFIWGVEHGLLDAKAFRPAIERGWAGLLKHVYADGRLGDIQPVGAAPGQYLPSSSYVYGVGAFLLAGAELEHWSSNDFRTTPVTQRTYRK